MFTTLVKTMLVVLPLAATATVAQNNDPYNALIWNRDNALAGNGQVDRRDWFEWWYYKIVDPDTHDAFLFTYGVTDPWDSGATLPGTAAVVEAGDIKSHALALQKFPVGQFQAAYNRTAVNIAGNTATDKQIQGHVVANGHDISWNISFSRKWRFPAMGWAMYVPNISGIYWYPAQASAEADGWVQVDGTVHTLNQAPAYQDRNWGQSFPEWWTWLVSNHFENSPETTLAAGGGEPKILNSVYLLSGLCIGLKYAGKKYIFRTTDMDYVNFIINWGTWSVVAENGHGQRIEISAYAPPDQFLLLPFISPRAQTFYDYEALLGKMTVKLYERASPFASWQPVTVLNTTEAGIEWGSPKPNSIAELFSSTSQFQ